MRFLVLWLFFLHNIELFIIIFTNYGENYIYYYKTCSCNVEAELGSINIKCKSVIRLSGRNFMKPNKLLHQNLQSYFNSRDVSCNCFICVCVHAQLHFYIQICGPASCQHFHAHSGLMTQDGVIYQLIF